MNNEIKCPSCNHTFTLNEIMSEELNEQMKAEKERLKSEAANWKKQKEEEYRKEMEKASAEARKAAEDTLNLELKALRDDAEKKTARLNELQKKELDYMRKQSEMEQREKNFEIEKEKYFLEKKTEIENTAVRREQELFDMKMKEKDIQMDSLKKTIDDLKRKSEQGSMQLQGEAQELLLEQVLREKFPGDIIEEIGKGAEGADCIHQIRNGSGKECGKIIYESKRTKAWSNSWIDKLKADMRNRNADVAILVTQTFPKDMERFGEKEGIWICSFSEVIGLAHVMRQGIIRVSEAQKAEENKGEKMQLLYNYLTGNEFRGQVEAIAEGFVAMKNSITRERAQMEKLWKEREKQLEKVLLNTAGLYGSVRGIAGASIAEIPALDGDSEQVLLDN
jgi:hypothetical protein